MSLAQAEVYEVATFYPHFDVVKEGETPPPAVTIRVCDSLTCAMAGAEALLAELPAQARRRMCAWCARPAWARATRRRRAAVRAGISRRVPSVAEAAEAHAARRMPGSTQDYEPVWRAATSC